MLKRSVPLALPEKGSVGGIDVGWSEKRASSAVARLSWDENSVHLSLNRFRAVEPERSRTILGALDGGVICAAIDGPLCTGLLQGQHYRFAERMLTLGFQPRIGKPGQTSSPNGRLLNQHATYCAALLAREGLAGTAWHEEKIHSLAIVEAFPTSFLGVLIADPTGMKTKRKASSDAFFEALGSIGALDDLLSFLLPDRKPSFRFEGLRNHDDRAALVCALTALCIGSGNYTAVGDNDGWIILPPYEQVQPWAHEIFAKNSARLSASGFSPKLGVKLGLLSNVYPAISVEGFNAADDEIANEFLTGSVYPEGAS